MSFIWATRGRSWGFTFLETAGLDDPLPEYERVTSALASSAGVARVGEAVAVKFRDPEGRRDRSGRPIPHGFVLYDDLARQVGDLDDARRVIWPLVAARYALLWDVADPASAHPDGYPSSGDV